VCRASDPSVFGFSGGCVLGGEFGVGGHLGVFILIQVLFGEGIALEDSGLDDGWIDGCVRAAHGYIIAAAASCIGFDLHGYEN